jgi:CheY-like chemotaxis protein
MIGEPRTDRHRARIAHDLERKALVPWRRKARILVVEDDPEMRLMLCGYLRRAGYLVIEATNGDDALDWLGPGVLEGDLERTPDLVVSDIRLPYFTGLEILEGLKLSPIQVPVILITGFGDDEVHAAAGALGAECVLDKPFALADLRRAVCAALAGRVPKPPDDFDGHVT